MLAKRTSAWASWRALATCDVRALDADEGRAEDAQRQTEQEGRQRRPEEHRKREPGFARRDLESRPEEPHATQVGDRETDPEHGKKRQTRRDDPVESVAVAVGVPVGDLAKRRRSHPQIGDDEDADRTAYQ
jgi:hypothetical protein